MITAQRGFQANSRDDHDLGLDARGARQPEALAPVAGGGGAGRAERVRARSRTSEEIS